MRKVDELFVDPRHGIDTFVSEDELRHYYIPYYCRADYGTTHYYVRQQERIVCRSLEAALRFLGRVY